MAMPKIDFKKLNIGQLKSSLQQLSHLNSPKNTESEVHRTIGLNIGRANLIAVEVAWHDKQPVLERLGRIQIAQGQNLSDQIKHFFTQMGFKSRRVSVSLKGQGVVVRFLSFPKMSRADFSSSIRYEAEKYLPFSLSEVNFDYQILNEINNSSGEAATMNIILVAARKTEVDHLLQVLQGAGLKPDLIDVDILACANAFVQSTPEIKEQCVGILDLGAIDSSFGIVDKGSLVFSRDIAFGGADLTEAIHRKLNVSPEEAFNLQAKLDVNAAEKIAVITEGISRLFQEIKSSITYYYNQRQTEIPLDAIYLSGGFSQLSILPKLLQAQVEVPIKTWNPTSQMKIGEEVDKKVLTELIPYLPVSIGLAIRPRS